MKIKQYFLIFAAVAVSAIALLYGVSPRWFARAFLGIPDLSPNVAHILRAVMCLYLALGAFWFYSAFSDRYRAAAVLTCIVFAGGLVIGRLLSFVADGRPAPLLVFYTVLELGLIPVAYWIHRLPEEAVHRGRLIDHIGLVVRDLSASKAFYAAIFDALKVPMGGEGDGYFWADELFVSTPDSAVVQGRGLLTGRHHLAFQAKDRAMVDAFYAAALARGGKDNGPPGERAYHAGYYAAFVLDPDGNNIEAVCHGEATRR